MGDINFQTYHYFQVFFFFSFLNHHYFQVDIKRKEQKHSIKKVNGRFPTYVINHETGKRTKDVRVMRKIPCENGKAHFMFIIYCLTSCCYCFF